MAQGHSNSAPATTTSHQLQSSTSALSTFCRCWCCGCCQVCGPAGLGGSLSIEIWAQLIQGFLVPLFSFESSSIKLRLKLCNLSSLKRLKVAPSLMLSSSIRTQVLHGVAAWVVGTPQGQMDLMKGQYHTVLTLIAVLHKQVLHGFTMTLGFSKVIVNTAAPLFSMRGSPGMLQKGNFSCQAP